MSKTNTWKLFPLRVPKEFHGRQKPERNLSEINQERTTQRENPEFVQSRIGHWQLKKLDRDVERERRDYVVTSSKISEDTPSWFQTTSHYYLRDNYNSRNRGKIVSHADGFSSTRNEGFKQDSFRMTGMSETKRVWKEPTVTGKVSSRDPSLSSTTRWLPSCLEVTPKVGSIETRDYTIRRPHLKVGARLQDNNFINTYSVA